MVDPYVYSGTSVLINQFGIKDPETLAVVEGRFFVLKSLEPLPVGQWDYEHLKAIHHHFFRDLYSWAGQERTVDLAKDNSYFAHVPFIAATLDQRFKQLKEEYYLQNLPLSTFCERLSYYFNEVNAVHPFREGNGRTQRAFFSSLAEQAGYYLDWKLLATRKEDYLQANVEGFLRADYQPLTILLAQIMMPINSLRQLALFTETPAINKTASMPEITHESLKTLLRQYVDLELEQTRLVNAMHSAKLQDPNANKAASLEALEHASTIQTFAEQVIEHPDIKSILETKQHIKPPHIADRGGFIGIRERLQQNQWLEEDIHVLTTKLKNKVASATQVQVQDRS